jgi:pyruvate formate lyase activating enzyme
MVTAIQKTTLLDYPHTIASILFFSGCNFRCPYCYNYELVLQTRPPLDVESILCELDHRRRYIDGVVISGGEPTLDWRLEDILVRIKEMGFSVKLDTNGSHPEVIQRLIEQSLVDYIAMDIKSDIATYPLVTGVHIDTDCIEDSMDILLHADISYEFRTTVVPVFHTRETFEAIGWRVKHARKYVLQQFIPERTLDPSFEQIVPYSRDVLQEFQTVLESHGCTVEIR